MANPQVIELLMESYRLELARVYGDDVAAKSEVSYRHGYFYVNHARRWADGSVGTTVRRRLGMRQRAFEERLTVLLGQPSKEG